MFCLLDVAASLDAGLALAPGRSTCVGDSLWPGSSELRYWLDQYRRECHDLRENEADEPVWKTRN